MEGAQSIHRTLEVLKNIADRNRNGAGLSELAAATGLAGPTVHRIVKALSKAGFVCQEKANRRYFLGPLVYDLGLTAAARFDMPDIYQAATENLAAATGDTVFFSRLSGRDMVCLARTSGSFPVKAFVMDVGVRRPLGVGAGGLAMLAALPEQQAEQIIKSNEPVYPQHDKTADFVRREVAEARTKGYVLRMIYRLGVTTLSMVVRDRSSAPFASISVSSISQRMDDTHINEILPILRSEVAATEKRITTSVITAPRGV